MNGTDIARVQSYLRKLLGNDQINVVAPPRKGATTEIAVGREVIGTVHRDEDEGEVSYSIHITVLEEDLAPATEAAPVPSGRTAGTRR